MEELSAQLAAKAGIEINVAEKSAGAILGFLRDEGRSDEAQSLIDIIPGAKEAIEVSNNSGDINRLIGGGLMALATRLMSLGLSMDDIRKIAHELLTYGCDKIGADKMGAIVAASPGLRQFA